MTFDEPRRSGRSERKRTAMLDAAQALFLTEGYERTSVDAIAARAEVSKRTVYDHFGDKQRVYFAVVDRVAAALMTSLRAAVAEELPDGCDLAPSLLAFVRRVATKTFPSSEYALFRRLVSATGGPPRLPEAMRSRPEDLLVERMDTFAQAGEITAPDPRRAAEHLIALTFLLALDTTDGDLQPDVDALLSDGVDAFLRAYRRPRAER